MWNKNLVSHKICDLQYTLAYFNFSSIALFSLATRSFSRKASDFLFSLRFSVLTKTSAAGLDISLSGSLPSIFNKIIKTNKIIQTKFFLFNYKSKGSYMVLEKQFRKISRVKFFCKTRISVKTGRPCYITGRETQSKRNLMQCISEKNDKYYKTSVFDVIP